MRSSTYSWQESTGGHGHQEVRVTESHPSSYPPQVRSRLEGVSSALDGLGIDLVL